MSPRITAVRTFLVAPDVRNPDGPKPGQWLYAQRIANPMSRYARYRGARESWGIDVLRSFCVEVEARKDAGEVVKGFAIGHGGFVGCFLVEEHLRRFLLGADPRDIQRLWDQMYRATQHYGRRGLAVMVLSVVDLALWDLLGRLRGEPVYRLIGGDATGDGSVAAYLTGPHPEAARAGGFVGGCKVPLPFAPDEPDSLERNYAALAAHRRAAGPGLPLMVDCYMALTVAYTTALVRRCADLDIAWWEEPLSPDDTPEGYTRLRVACPAAAWAAGEHEATRHGFRRLADSGTLDVLQPDITWCGGLSELLRIATHAAAYGVAVVPHGCSHYTAHFAVASTNTPLIEFVAYSADGRTVAPVHGDFFVQEPLPVRGRIAAAQLDRPGFGLTVSPHVRLVPAKQLLAPYYAIFGELRENVEAEERGAAAGKDEVEADEAEAAGEAEAGKAE